MNKEFIGKKRFYLNEDPDTYVDARLYVVETRNSEYITAVMEDGTGYPVESIDGPCEELSDVRSFTDIDNRLFLEYPTKTSPTIRFFDRKGNEIGIGEISVINVKSNMFYVADFTSSRSFKYKKNGWDFQVERGEHIVVPMYKDTIFADVIPFVCTLFGGCNKVNVEVLSNKYYQIHCRKPEINLS